MPRIGTPESYAARREAVRLRSRRPATNAREMPHAGQHDYFRGGKLFGRTARSVSAPSLRRARSTDGRLPAP